MVTNPLSVYREQIGCSIDCLATEIALIISQVVENSKVKFRVKDIKTLQKKMVLKRAYDVSQIDDIYGIRVLLDCTEDVYLAYGKITSSYQGYLDHDYIKNPKTNFSLPGKELRLIQYIVQKNGLTFEIQFTTHEFDAKNEELHEEYHRKKYK